MYMDMHVELRDLRPFWITREARGIALDLDARHYKIADLLGGWHAYPQLYRGFSHWWDEDHALKVACSCLLRARALVRGVRIDWFEIA